MLTYTFDPPKAQKPYRRYRAEELQRMTTFQLQDICEQENIIHAAIDEMDPEELRHLILTFRGSRTPMLIMLEKEDGEERVQTAMKATRIREIPHRFSFPAKITVFEGLDINLFDGYSIPYDSELDNVNAAVVDHQGNICTILQMRSFPNRNELYLCKSGAMPCREAEVRDYRLYLFPQKLSDAVFRIYSGEGKHFPPEISLYSVPLLDFVVRKPVDCPMPLVLDFGTSNTAAGVYISGQFHSRVKDGVHSGQIQPDAINYVQYLTADGETAPVIPSVIGVDRIESGTPVYNIGFEAEKMVTEGYMGEGFCIFYDIKRWVGNFEAEEELSDHAGHRLLVKRKDIIRSFLLYVIENARQRFKCNFKNVFLSYPVKQKARFLSLYHEVLPEYEVNSGDLIDEGVSVLYDTLGRLIDGKQYEEGKWSKVLIIDCGGGTTDQSSCRFSIQNDRVSYRINIETAYENGDTDFGGMNLTFRILQLLKIAAASLLAGQGYNLRDVAHSFDIDTYRVVDEQGAAAVYQSLEEAYAAAEEIIPTRFKEYEYRERSEYFMVRNNFYYLFNLAEKVKKTIFADTQAARIVIGSREAQEYDEDMIFQFAPRWKMAARLKGKLAVIKEFPNIELSLALVKSALGGDIYDVIRRFLEGFYLSDDLKEYRIVTLTGQSCKIDTFRDALKEYIPGRKIRGRKKSGSEDYRLKLTCLEGAIRYISDRRLGVSKVNITSASPALPYYLSAYSHTGDPVVLVHPLDRAKNYGSISRSIGSVELRLHLSNTGGTEKYVYTIYCEPESFQEVTYMEIKELYEGHIPQAEVDVIENGEVRYFIWTDSGEWGFSVVPVSRQDDQLRLGGQQMFPFENESWIVNFFSGEW